jgi:hypothetical protein
MKIKVCDYNFISNSRTETGFIAQDLYEVYPLAVGVGGDDPKKEPWGVDYGKITPLLTKAVQDLNIKVESLEKDNEALKMENQKLKDDITKLTEYEQRLRVLEKQVQLLLQPSPAKEN